MTAIPKYRKKLIEVALPLKAINDESSRRKRKAPAGYPTTIHKWWAQRPIAACRAVLFASLVNDPSDDPMYGVNEDIAAAERAKLFNLIEDLITWESSNDSRVINAARAEIARSVAANKVADGEWKNDQVIVKGHGKPATAHAFKHKLADSVQVNAFLSEHAPPMLDPFCGGGSIPLEAQRLGLRAYASDLNPVPVLITKALIEIPSRFDGRPPVNPDWQATSSSQRAATAWHGAQGLADDLRFYANLVRDKLRMAIGSAYPDTLIDKSLAKERPELRDYIGARLPTVAWLWARTVKSPDPSAHGTYVPLATTFRLRSKGDVKVWIEPVIDKSKSTYRLTVRTGTPSSDEAKRAAAGTKTSRGAYFRCIVSGSPLDDEYVREQFVKRDTGVCLLAVVAEGKSKGRVYLPPTPEHVAAATNCDDPLWIPDQPMNQDCSDLVSGRGYGFLKWGDLFTKRQLLAHSSLSHTIEEIRRDVLGDTNASGVKMNSLSLADGGSGAVAYADAIVTLLTFALIRSIDYNSAFSSWRHKDSALRSTLAKQAIPMVWDFAEANPFTKSSGGFAECAAVVAKCLEFTPTQTTGTVTQLDATEAVMNVDHPMVCCDPPYYSNISYADLSDFLYVWQRKCLSPIFPTLFATLLTPKSRELIAAPYRHGGEDSAKDFFEDGLRAAFTQIRKAANQEYPVTIFYAFKQTEEDEDGEDETNGVTALTLASTGWETMLDALVRSGFEVSGTWPMRTEGDNRQIGVGRNALASSIVLVCRPRSSDAPIATRKQLMNILRQELPDALRNLRYGHIAPVDMAQAAIGPGMAVFTRFAKVIESDGLPMAVRTALGIINQVLDEVLAEQEGEFDGNTRWAIAWFEQFGTAEGPFGVAETLSKAKNAAVNRLEEARIVKARGGKVQLVSRGELSDNWDPATDNRLSAWESTQHLIRTLEQQGESAAAGLLNKLGGFAETARDLAYRLYSICERNKWADEALAYNSLVIAWPELTKLALAERNREPTTQTKLF